MSVSNEAMTLFLVGWETLKKQRPTERDFAPYGYPNLTYEHLDQIFDRWVSIFAALGAKGTWITSPEAALADRPIATLLADLTGLASGAVNNGINWMVGSGFVQKVLDVQTQVTSLTSRRISISRELAKDLSAKGHDEIERILAAEHAAKAISELSEAVYGDADSASKSASEISKSLESTKELVEELSGLSESAKSAAGDVVEARDQVVSALKLVADLQKTAHDRDEVLVKQIEVTDVKVQATYDKAVEAFDSVTQALRAARDQGLAGAFQSRSNKLRAERRLWIIVFIGAIAVLSALTIVFAINLEKMTYEFLIVSILRKLALAAPAIWLGWYGAKQIGRIGRVQEDYEYKAASALAFQSYKDEVKFNGDPELLKQLLGIAIATFGDNPVRLYADTNTDSVTPLEDALKKLPPDKITEFMAALAKLKSS